MKKIFLIILLFQTVALMGQSIDVEAEKFPGVKKKKVQVFSGPHSKRTYRAVYYFDNNGNAFKSFHYSKIKHVSSYKYLYNDKGLLLEKILTYDVEGVSQYIDGVDFEINRPYGNSEGVKYVYETTIDGVKVRADVYYSTSTKNKMVQLLKYDNSTTPVKTGGYGLGKSAYTIRFLPKVGGWDIGRMSFGSTNQYQQYLRSKLY